VSGAFSPRAAAPPNGRARNRIKTHIFDAQRNDDGGDGDEDYDYDDDHWTAECGSNRPTCFRHSDNRLLALNYYYNTRWTATAAFLGTAALCARTRIIFLMFLRVRARPVAAKTLCRVRNTVRFLSAIRPISKRQVRYTLGGID